MGADDPTLPESPRSRRTSQSLDLVVILGEQLCVDAGLEEGDPRRERIATIARRLYDAGRDAGRSEERRAMAAGAIGGLQRKAPLEPRQKGERDSMAGQRLTIPAWAIGALLTLLSAGASAAVTYGVMSMRLATLERDTVTLTARVERVDAARFETERTIAILLTRLDSIETTGRETRDELRELARRVEQALPPPSRR